LRGAGGYLLDRDGKRFMAEYDAKGERATRDIVSRAMFDVIKKGRATPLGGIYLEMKHLGPDNVRRAFKGMVERCADCGFDLAGGRVEVIPTAHYMMGGVRFAPDCATALAGLYAAGEDTGGVHGANRLGGNGVANSTVFGSIAGASLARGIATDPFRAPDERALAAATEAANAPFAKPPGDLGAIRERLYGVMWEDAGIVRDAAGLARAEAALAGLDRELGGVGVAGGREFNLAWHAWLDLKSLVLASRAVVAAARAREDSAGAHFRADRPQAADPARAYFTCATLKDGALAVSTEPVKFTRLKPGESLLGTEKTAAAR
jgi:fumarate reductase flavoprotein subunit